MSWDIPDELIGLVETFVFSNRFEWLQYKDVQDFVLDSAKRRIDALIIGPSYERQRS